MNVFLSMTSEYKEKQTSWALLTTPTIVGLNILLQRKMETYLHQLVVSKLLKTCNTATEIRFKQKPSFRESDTAYRSIKRNLKNESPMDENSLNGYSIYDCT